MPSPYAPPPTELGSGTPVITVDVESIGVHLEFDVAQRTATARARVDFLVDGPGGRPALDLRQPVSALRLDGRALEPGTWAHHDLGGGAGAEMRVLDVDLPAGGRHTLEVDYELGTPDARAAEPVGWNGDGVRFDLWMSDLHPGRYLEMWVPAPLCHDHFALSATVRVLGTQRPHVVISNASVNGPSTGTAWDLSWPAAGVALSPMLVVAPADEIERRTAPVVLPGSRTLLLHTARHAEVDADLPAAEADVAAWLPHLHARYGPWAHGGSMTVLLWAPSRGMEYDGATTASVGALEHEVFHSWFGRGVKPARASDGWIDEAWTSWATATRRSEEARFAVAPLGLDEPPVTLWPAHPWARRTVIESYTAGARLFAGVAAAVGGAPTLRSAMGAWYRDNRGGLVTTAGLLTHLERSTGTRLRPLWDRYVYGGEPPATA